MCKTQIKLQTQNFLASVCCSKQTSRPESLQRSVAVKNSKSGMKAEKCCRIFIERKGQDRISINAINEPLVATSIDWLSCLLHVLNENWADNKMLISTTLCVREHPVELFQQYIIYVATKREAKTRRSAGMLACVQQHSPHRKDLEHICASFLFSWKDRVSCESKRVTVVWCFLTVVTGEPLQLLSWRRRSILKNKTQIHEVWGPPTLKMSFIWKPGKRRLPFLSNILYGFTDFQRLTTSLQMSCIPAKGFQTSERGAFELQSCQTGKWCLERPDLIDVLFYRRQVLLFSCVGGLSRHIWLWECSCFAAAGFQMSAMRPNWFQDWFWGTQILNEPRTAFIVRDESGCFPTSARGNCEKG